MAPVQRKVARTTTIATLVSSAQSSVETVAAAMISVPPMVGVPAFFRWVSGPFSRTTCPKRNRVSQRIIAGPSRKVSTSAVTTAPAVRKVMYVNRLKPICTSVNRGRR